MSSVQSAGIYSLGVSDTAKIRFSWRSNSEPNLAGYKLYVSTVSGVYANFVDVGRATTFELPDLLRGMTYYFALTAYNTGGVESDFTPELTYRVPLVERLPGAITVPADLNTPPAISPIPDQSLSKNQHSDPIPLSVSDMETPETLELTAYSSNPFVVHSSGVIFGGSAANRTLTIDPVNGQIGIATVTIAVTDGAATSTISFLVTVEH